MILYTIKKLFLIIPCLVLLLFNRNILSQSLEIDKVIFVHKDTKIIPDNVLSDAVAIYQEKFYKSKILGDDITKLQKFYFDNGFFDAKVDTMVKYNLDAGNVTINFIIYENKRYKIDTLKYGGLDLLSPLLLKRVDSIKTVKKKDNYNKVLIIQQTNEIVDLLQNNGYMNAGIKKDSGTIVRKYDSSVTLIIYFTRADTVNKFGKTKISITKNIYNVDDDIFTKLLTYKEGDIYSKTEKLETEKYMSGYGIVQSARLEPDTSQKDGAVDFKANILLTKKNEITPFIEGADMDNTFYLGGGLRYTNKYFLSGGKVLSFELQAFVHDIHVNRLVFIAGVTQPYIFNINSTLSDKIITGLYNLQGFKAYSVSNLTRLDYYISDHTFYKNAQLDLTEEMDWFKYDIDSTGTLTLFNSYINGTIVHDNTNSPTSPTKGLYQSFTAGEGGLIPSLVIRFFNKDVRYSQFFKLYTYNRFYLDLRKLMQTLVFATAFKVGDIIEFGKGDKVIPVQPLYRFFSGGSGSLRAWSPKGNGELINRLNGGEFLFEGSFEFRKTLFPSSETFTKNIGIAVFVDYGNVWETHSDFRFNQIALSIGFGPRYNLFIGPIRIDLGFKLYDPSDSKGEKWLFNNFSRMFKDKYAISFGVGEAF